MAPILCKCQDIIIANRMETEVDFSDLLTEIDIVLNRSPAGGMVDTWHSNCHAAMRPGSSPGPGTTFSEERRKLYGLDVPHTCEFRAKGE